MRDLKNTFYRFSRFLLVNESAGHTPYLVNTSTNMQNNHYSKQHYKIIKPTSKPNQHRISRNFYNTRIKSSSSSSHQKKNSFKRCP